MTIGEFEHFLLVYQNQLKKLFDPPNLQVLSFKFETIEFLVDEYYSINLINTAIRSENLKEFNLEIQQLS